MSWDYFWDTADYRQPKKKELHKKEYCDYYLKEKLSKMKSWWNEEDDAQPKKVVIQDKEEA